MSKSISKQEIQRLQQQLQPVRLIDIRTPGEFAKLHVPGAINIPLETIKESNMPFDPDDLIVCICNKGLERSQDAAESFTEIGYTRVFYLEEGTFGW